MEEIQLDYATLVSVYQSKISDLYNQVVILEAKNVVLTKKMQELFENQKSDYDAQPNIAAASPRKKAGEANS